jgi:RNA polymerase sigma-70 factor (ECF subfamily)
MNPEADLIRMAQSGDMNAFTELVQRHDREVFALAARYVQSAEDAKDIYQEVMMKVFRGLPGFQFRSEFSTWVHRITVNVCVTHRKRSRRALHVSLDPDVNHAAGADATTMELRSKDGGPDDVAMNADTADHVRRALQDLSPRQRMVFTLRHYEGRSLKDIAHMLVCTEGTVKRYLFMATHKMRDQLQHLL